MGTDTDKTTSTGKSTWRRRLVWGFLFLLILAFVAPQIIARTSLRDLVLGSLVGDSGWTIASDSASLGWTSPVVVHGLELHDRRQTTRIKINRVAAEKSWLSLFMSFPNLGAFEIDRPEIITIVEEEAERESTSTTETQTFPTLTTHVNQAHIVVRRRDANEPVIDVDQVDLTVHLTHEEQGHQLVIDGIKVFDRKAIAPDVLARGIHLIAPVLDGEIRAEGSLSLDIETLSVPLDANAEDFAERVQLRGDVVLHEFTAELENPITRRLVMMFAEILDLGEIPQQVSISDETRLRFDVRDGRIHHESYALLFPSLASEFQMATQGSVGLDESLDLSVTVRLPIELLGQGELAAKVAETPIELNVSGTIDEPVIGLKDESDWVAGLNDALQNPSPADAELASDLLRLIAKLRDSG